MNKSSNPVFKKGDVLIATDPCIIVGTDTEALQVGKKYTIQSTSKIGFTVNSEIEDDHYFTTWDQDWVNYFKVYLSSDLEYVGMKYFSGKGF